MTKPNTLILVVLRSESVDSLISAGSRDPQLSPGRTNQMKGLCQQVDTRVSARCPAEHDHRLTLRRGGLAVKAERCDATVQMKLMRARLKP